jgi:hypothetical protein
MSAHDYRKMMTNHDVATHLAKWAHVSNLCTNADRLEECWPNQASLDRCNEMLALDNARQ